MSARALGAVFLVCVALGLGGCAREAPARPARWSVPADTVGTASPTAAASPTIDWSALQAKAKSGAIAPNGLAGIGVTTRPKEDKPVAYDLTGACGKRIEADSSGPHVAYNRTWSAQGWWISNTVHAYAATTGAEAVSQARAAVESCQTYTASDGTHTLLGPERLPLFPGIDARYGYCQRINRTDATYVSCLAFLAKGNLVSALWIVHGSTAETNSSGLAQVAPTAAEALRAVP